MTGRDAMQILQNPLTGEKEQGEARGVMQLLAELVDAWCLLDDEAKAEELLDLSEQELQRELDCLDDLLYHCAFVSQQECFWLS